MSKSEKRDSILETANRLFETNGFKATGVDQIAAEAGVTKRTLYKHFESKEQLIQIVLQEHNEQMLQHFKEQLSDPKMPAKQKLLHCFDLYRTWFEASTFSGCIFIKSVNEFANCSVVLSQVAQQAKASMRDLILRLVKEAKLKNPETLSDQLQILLEGSIVVAQMGKGSQAADTAKEVARFLINRRK